MRNEDEDRYSVILHKPRGEEEALYMGNSKQWARVIFDAGVRALTHDPAHRNHILRHYHNGVEIEAFIPCKS